MTRPKGIIETQRRKQMATRCSPDADGYTGIDSGCKFATLELNRQSRCLECHWEKCLLDRNLKYKEYEWSNK